MRAIWNGRVIAESDKTVVVEGRHYFPLASVDASVLRPSEHHSTCSWKGEASYYTLEADGQLSADSVFYYPEPKQPARMVTDRVAFWKDVEVRP